MTTPLPSQQEMFDIAYRKLAERSRNEAIRDADYLAKTWTGHSITSILTQIGIPMPKPEGRPRLDKTKTKSGEIGYKKPPQHAQFKPGQSGNPRGRPREKTQDDSSNTLNAIQRRIFGTPLTMAQAGVVTEIHPLDALYRNRNKLAFQGSIHATENSIREIRDQMERDEKEKARQSQSVREWLNSYPERLIAIHEGRLDIKYCIPHPDYYTFHADGRITIKGPQRYEDVYQFETIKDYATRMEL
jgi:hypothetical protein